MKNIILLLKSIVLKSTFTKVITIVILAGAVTAVAVPVGISISNKNKVEVTDAESTSKTKSVSDNSSSKVTKKTQEKETTAVTLEGNLTELTDENGNTYFVDENGNTFIADENGNYTQYQPQDIGGNVMRIGNTTYAADEYGNFPDVTVDSGGQTTWFYHMYTEVGDLVSASNKDSIFRKLNDTYPYYTNVDGKIRIPLSDVEAEYCEITVSGDGSLDSYTTVDGVVTEYSQHWGGYNDVYYDSLEEAEEHVKSVYPGAFIEKRVNGDLTTYVTNNYGAALTFSSFCGDEVVDILHVTAGQKKIHDIYGTWGTLTNVYYMNPHVDGVEIVDGMIYL